MDDEVPPDIAQDRLERLQIQQRDQTLAYHQSRVGEDAVVLIDGTSRRGGNQLSGRDRHLRVVNVDLSANHGILPGDKLPVRLVEATPHSLIGEPSEERLRP
jgi:tRNA-2-methylthio-N6-dimethylallyladenosine synthase